MTIGLPWPRDERTAERLDGLLLLPFLSPPDEVGDRPEEKRPLPARPTPTTECGPVRDGGSLGRAK